VPHHETVISSTDLGALRADLASAGVFRHRTAATWTKLLLLLAAFALMTAAVVAVPWWCALILIPLAAVPAIAMAMIAHEAAHGSFSASRIHNLIVLHAVFPLFGGLSAQHWIEKHNRKHHGHPNVAGKDPDIEIWPMALSRDAYEQSGRMRRWVQRHLQGYLFWPLTLFLGFVMRIESWRHIARAIRQGGLTGPLAADIACLVGHYTLWLVVPSLWFGVGPVLAFYGGLWAIGGLLLALVFAPAHMGLPVVSGHENPWLHQLTSTRNFSMPRWLSWFFVGLDFQVEHHLFPRIPHQHLPQASAIARDWCARIGAPHQRLPYAAAVVDVTRHMHASWRQVPADRSAS
jgi:fatty acid desaturase